MLIRGGSATVFVADLDRAVAFYSETLGLGILYRAGPHFAMIDGGDGFQIGLHPAREKGPQPGAPGCIQIGLNVVSAIEDAVEGLRARGVEFDQHDGGAIVDDDAVKLAFFRDPDGTELYLCEVQKG